MAYRTSTVRDIYRFAVFCSVTRLFFVSLVFMKGTSCCVLRSWGVRPSYGKSFEVGRTMVYTTRKTVNRLARILWRQNDQRRNKPIVQAPET